MKCECAEDGFLGSGNPGLGSVWDQAGFLQLWSALGPIFHFFYLCLKIMIKVGAFLFKT